MCAPRPRFVIIILYIHSCRRVCSRSEKEKDVRGGEYQIFYQDTGVFVMFLAFCLCTIMFTSLAKERVMFSVGFVGLSKKVQKGLKTFEQIASDLMEVLGWYKEELDKVVVI